jgi:uncharacterized protein (TIGR02996 family)
MARRKASKPVPAAEPEEAGFLVAIKQSADDTTARAAYADWLEEHDRAYEAAVQRDRAGVSEVWYKVRRKTDGLFAEPDHPKRWTKGGKRWRSLKQVVPHMHNMLSGRGSYLGVKWENLEIVVVEIRPQHVATLPVSIRQPYPQWPSIVTFAIDEPVTPSLPKGLGANPGAQPPSQSERGPRADAGGDR